MDSEQKNLSLTSKDRKCSMDTNIEHLRSKRTHVKDDLNALAQFVNSNKNQNENVEKNPNDAPALTEVETEYKKCTI